MSKTVDERVVSMQFDNKHFERNVSTTMSTLDKLKQKLKFNDASKGLENVNTAAKKVDMTGLGHGVETVRAKFSALQVMGVTALTNITNSAVNAGKRIVSALTIDPIKTGFQEYETQINSVQTILANTESKGSTLKDVNKALDELNTYADKTIYNFTEMTRNIGTFTAAGVDLDTSVNAIKGIANLAAVSGSTSQQASTAMYQLSQALASGTVKLMDWNSVVNAGMGGQVFQDALKETARVHGVAIDSMIEKNGSFRETLKDGWLTSEILTDTLQKFTLTTEGLTEEQIKANREMLKAKGYTEEQIDEIFKLGNTATNAATKVKTFTQLWDVLKETAQSGWAKTWKLIFGDFEEARSLFTPLADFLTGIIQKISDARNALIEGALSNPFTKTIDNLKKVKKASDKVTDGFEDISKAVEEVLNGKWGTGQKRWDALAEAGYNWAKVQNKVNEELGSSVRHSEELGESQKKLKDTEEKVTETKSKTIQQMAKMSDEQLKAIGLTKDEIDSLRELEKAAEKAGYSLEEVLADVSLLDGRNLLIDSFRNIGKVFSDIFGAIKTAWQETFDPIFTSTGLYDLIANFHDWTENIQLTDETIQSLTTTIQGLFSSMHVIALLTSGPIKIVFNIIKELMKIFDVDLLKASEWLAQVIIDFDKWLSETLKFKDIAKEIAPYIQKMVEAIKGFADGIKNSDGFKKFTGWLRESFESLSEWIAGIKDAENVGKYILEGIANGIKNGAKAVWDAIVSVANGIITKICEVLGIHSPSTVMTEVGENVMAGLGNGIQNGFSKIWEIVKNVASNIGNFFKNIDWGTVLAFGITTTTFIGLIKGLRTVEKALDTVSGLFDGLGGMFKGIGSFFSNLGASFKASIWEKRSKAILNMAISVGILVGVLFVLVKMCEGTDAKTLWHAIGVLAVLSLIVAGLAIACNALNNSMVSVDKSGIKSSGGTFGTIIAIGASLFLMVLALKKIADLDINNVWQSVGVLTALLLELGIMVLAFSQLAKFSGAKGVKNVGKTLLGMSVALFLMTVVINRISKISDGDLVRGTIVIGAFVGLMALFVSASKFAGEHASKAGGMLLKMSLAMLVMVAVVKLVSGMSDTEVERGLEFVAMVELLFIAVVAVSRLAGQNSTKAGSMLLQMSAAMLIMTFVVKRIADMSEDDIKKGLAVITAIEILFGALIVVSKFAGEHAAKAGVMLLLMSGALFILTGVMYLLSIMDPSGMGRALGVITVLEAFYGGLIWVTGKAGASKDLNKTLITMTVTIALLAVAIAALSFIEPERLYAASASLSMVMAMFAGLIAVTKLSKNTKQMIRTLAVMAGVTLILAGIVVALSYIPNADAALKNVAALSVLMLSFSAAMLIIKQMNNRKKFPIEALGQMLLVVAGLALILGAMSALNVEASISTAIALSTVLLAMSAAMVILNTIKGSSTGAVTAMMLLGIVVAEIALVFGLLSAFDIAPSLETAAALSVVLLAMSAACAIVSLIPAAAAIQGALGLAAFVGIMAAVLAILGGLSKIPGFNELIKDGGETLALIGYAIGNFVGSIVGGLVDGVTSCLPALGEHLSGFMTNAQAFIEGAKNVDASLLEGIGVLAAAIIALSVAEIISGIASIISFGSSLSDLGTQLSMFMINAMPFVTTAMTIKPEMVEGVKALSEAILILTGANLIDKIASFLGGGSSLSDFGAQLGYLGQGLSGFAANVGDFSADQIETVNCASQAIKTLAQASSEIPNSGGLLGALVGENDLGVFAQQFPILGTGLKDFLTNIGTFTEDQVATVECAANAIKLLAQAASEIPNAGGLLADIVGDNELSTFATQFPILGTGLKDFLTNIGTFTEDQVATVECAANAIKLLAQASSEIPNSGGWVGAIIGENDLSTFAEQFPILGTGLKDFLTNLGTFTEDQVATIKTACNAVISIASAASQIPNSGGWVGAIVGDNDLGTFAEQFPSLGTGLKGFATELGTFGDSQLATVNAGINAVEAIAKLSGTDLSGTSSVITGFGAKLVTFGEHIGEFCASMTSFESTTLYTAISNVNKVVDLIKKLEGFDADAAEGFRKAVKDVARTGVDKFIETFTSAETMKDVKAAAEDMVANVIEGIKGKHSDIETAGTKLAGKAIDGLGGVNDAGIDAGEDLGKGLVRGIKRKETAVYWAAYNLGQKAVQGEKDGQKSQSPSKLTIQAGKWLGEGLIVGMEEMGRKVYAAGSNMGETATKTISSSVSAIADAINTDMDSQPTIRPVLDLSDVRSGASAIGGLFSTNPSVGVLANVGAISSMMNQNGQNGGNGDVVSAINKLRKDLGNVGNTTNYINGVTYDDGSNITGAVEQIIRAARVGRRV